jgi:hypothetical protein
MIIEKAPISAIIHFPIPNDPALYEDDAGRLEFFSPESAETDSEDECPVSVAARPPVVVLSGRIRLRGYPNSMRYPRLFLSS